MEEKEQSQVDYNFKPGETWKLPEQEYISVSHWGLYPTDDLPWNVEIRDKFWTPREVEKTTEYDTRSKWRF